jgi:hypothetical protein
MVRGVIFALALALSACCADTSQFCAQEYGAECVQAAFDSEQACSDVGSDSAQLGCSTEFDAYLACLDTALDCGSCEILAWT